MKNKKNKRCRVMGWILSLCMIFTMLPVSVFAENDYPDDIEIDATFDGFAMDIFLNDQRVQGGPAPHIQGTAKGYASGQIHNVVKIQLDFGAGNIGSVTINGQNMTINEDVRDEVSFEVAPASKYTIVVTKRQDETHIPRTLIWASDKTNNPDLHDDELLKNGSIEIIDIKDENGSSVGLNDVKQDLNKNNGWASIIPGSKVILKLKPDYGYQLTTIKINDQELIASQEQSIFTYTMPDTNVHISGIFTKVDDQVKTLSNEVKSGTIQIDDSEIDTGSVVLSVNDTSLSDNQKSNFQKSISGYQISSYLDINLNQVIYKGTKDEVWQNELKNLQKNATISLQLQNNINGNEMIVVHEKHDGSYETIPTTYNPYDHSITFETSSFSNYALASKITTTNQNSNNITNHSIDTKKKAVKTGDTMNNVYTWFVVLIISSIVLTMIVLYRLKIDYEK